MGVSTTGGISTRLLLHYSVISVRAKERRYMMTGVLTLNWRGQNESIINYAHGFTEVLTGRVSRKVRG